MNSIHQSSSIVHTKIYSSAITTYTYNARGQQTGYSKDGVTASYTYLPTGLRKSKTVGITTTNFVWDGQNMVYEYNSTNSTGGTAYYYGLTLISQGNYAYYLYNAHGDVVQLISSTGSLGLSYNYDAFGNEVNPSATDTNPFRYAGQYYDKETGTYYLRARYYDPSVGRFTQQDGWQFTERNDSVSLNLYTYCYGNPVRYVDYSGNIPIETILDVAGIIGSTVDLFTDPSWANLGFWAWDIGATFLPYIPGSYTAKGVKMLGKADDAIDAVKALNRVDNLTDAAKVFVDNHRSIVGSYKDIKKTVKALGLKGFEVHHLIEKRFVHALGIDSADEILAVALDNDTHKKITREIRDIIGYKFDLGKEAVTGTASVDQIWSALVTVYENNEMESYLPLIKQYLIDNAKHIGEISNWKGY